jgi:hypothetical protein
MSEPVHPEVSAKRLLTYLVVHRGVMDAITARRNHEANGLSLDDFVSGLAYARDRSWIEVDSEQAFLILTPDGQHFIEAAVWTEGAVAEESPRRQAVLTLT